MVGPELPLTLGVVDEFMRRGWPVFGPTKAAAQLEGEQEFREGIFAAASDSDGALCDLRFGGEVRSALAHFHAPVVVKADGLAAGKGVVIAASKEEAASAAAEMLSGKMVGEAGTRVVLEECLERRRAFVSRVQRRRARCAAGGGAGSQASGRWRYGPNTGGMGAYSTADIVDDKMRDWLVNHIARPVVAGMKAEGAEYKGVLYCGLMMTARGPMVLEFNCRFGDPETQPILMRLESDLVDALEASIAGRVSEGDFKWSQDASVCVVMAFGRISGDV